MFTNDFDIYCGAIAFRVAAMEDGWNCVPMYGSEPLESAARLIRDDFKMNIIVRVTGTSRFKYECEVSIWGIHRMCMTGNRSRPD
jgi:hypothetical protein